jgi:hypothetical protein
MSISPSIGLIMFLQNGASQNEMVKKEAVPFGGTGPGALLICPYTLTYLLTYPWS